MIELHLKDFNYNNSQILFKNIRLQLTLGKPVNLYGNNGSGKTTLLKLLAGIIEDEQYCSQEDLSYAPSTSDSLFFHLTGEENLRLFNLLNNVDEKNHLKFIPDNVPSTLEKSLQTKAIYSSNGMKQSINLLRAISAEAKLVLLDEPFNGFDKDTTLFFNDLIQSHYCKNRFIVMTSHQPREGWCNISIEELEC
tara:strand:+ start:39287 stop:39868 length:582 start_codon:yes stop_codon:yes gene_type:complete